MKIVINRCFGGFGLSKLACEEYAKAKGLNLGEWKDAWGFFEGGDFYDRSIPRNDSVLIEIVERLGDKANGNHAELHIVDIPDDVDWEIHEYDGNEWVAEKHRTWY